MVAYRDGQLYCICTKAYDGPATGATGHQLAVVACTAFVLSHRMAIEGTGHQLAVVAYRDCQLYCICTMS